MWTIKREMDEGSFSCHLNTNEKHVLLKFDFFLDANFGDDLLMKLRYKNFYFVFLVKSKDVVTLYVELFCYFF